MIINTPFEFVEEFLSFSDNNYVSFILVNADMARELATEKDKKKHPNLYEALDINKFDEYAPKLSSLEFAACILCHRFTPYELVDKYFDLCKEKFKTASPQIKALLICNYGVENPLSFFSISVNSPEYSINELCNTDSLYKYCVLMGFLMFDTLSEKVDMSVKEIATNLEVLNNKAILDVIPPVVLDNFKRNLNILLNVLFFMKV